MSVQMVRFSTDAERVHEVEDAIAALFTAVSAAAPTGMTYAAGRVGDGPDFVFLLQLAEGVDNPLLGIPDALDSAAGSLDGRRRCRRSSGRSGPGTGRYRLQWPS